MSYKYSICYPDKAEIEYRNNLISSDEVLNIAKNYPWLEQLNVMDNLDENKIYYNPSLDFNSLKDGKSFALTANYGNNKKLEFSLWYNRPKKVKVLFGLLGEKEKMSVDDVWSIDFEDALKYLQHFLNGEFQKVESLYK